LSMKTDYPFSGSVSIDVEGHGSFPLYLRVPRWCGNLTIKINGEAISQTVNPGAYLRIERQWAAGDSIEITMPMEIALTRWPRNGSVSVDRGPLSYSVKIEELWERWEGSEQWPQWEVLPKSPWNYALVLDPENPSEDILVIEKGISSDQPWDVDSAPIELRVKAKRIPSWKIGDDNTVEAVPQNLSTLGPVETISMIPLGCARLRMSCLPVALRQKGEKE
ncbi:MAG: hypothetical protein HN368_16715, partial [Spirochaetales bacterium]|nr:hypothetical protein [Spirochaetales bacterium]